MPGRRRDVRAFALLAMALTSTGAMAGQRTGTLHVSVEVVAACSVGTAAGRSVSQSCTAPTVSRTVVEQAAAAPPGDTRNAIGRSRDGSILTVIY
jgi:hypothetical protein